MISSVRGSWVELVRRRIRPPACARPGCERMAKFWRAVPPVRMQGEWLCSPQCLEAEARLAFARMCAQQDVVLKHRVPLGLLMLARGYLNEQQLQAVLAEQRRTREGKIGEWVQRLNFASERQVLTALSVQWACPVLTLRAAPERDAIDMLPRALVQSLNLMPVRLVRSTRLLYVALSERVDHTALAAIESMLDCKVVACLVSDRVMSEWLRGESSSNSARVHVFERMSGAKEMARITGSYIARLGTEDVRIERCGRFGWARLVSQRRATDLLFNLGSVAAEYESVEREKALGAAV